MMSCFPTTTTTCVILTKLAEGNEAATLFNATLANLAGIFLSPMLMYLYLHTSASIPFGQIILVLLLTVVLPLIVGQIIRLLLRGRFISSVPWGVVTYLILFFIVFTVFSDTFNSDSPVALTEWAIVAVILFGIQLLLGGLSFGASSLLKFPPEDRISAVYASMQKTLGMGIPFINIIYEDDPNIYLVYLPILVYHPLQIALGSLIASPLRDWVQRSKYSNGTLLQDPEEGDIALTDMEHEEVSISDRE